MFVLVGWLICIVCVFGVFIFHGGNIGVVLKALPFELITIGGATLGAFVANNQMKVIKATLKGLGACFKVSKYTKAMLLASMQGYNPSTSIEFGRQILFSTERPTFIELEAHVKKKQVRKAQGT